jgi:zona occludens toxin (predicted ATPase)
MDISLSSLNSSPKKNGKFEEVIIDRIFKHYLNKGYNIKKHASFNIAWGSVVSEIDLILIDDEKVTIFEVKSKQDKLKKAHKQIEKFRKYADYIYVASDTLIDTNSFDESIGIMYVGKNVDVLRDPIKISYNITAYDLKKLKKVCLGKMVEAFYDKKNITKNQMVLLIKEKYNQETINKLFRKVAFCDGSCKKCSLI